MRDEPEKSTSVKADQILPKDAVQKQLAGILASPEFQGKPTLSRFLRFIVEQTLSGCSHQIKGFTIATEVLKKKENFDAVKDPTVRILAGKLRASLERYYLIHGAQDPVHIAVPKGTYVPVFRDLSLEKSRQQAAFPFRRETGLISMPSGPGIAVLPMVNLSNDPEQEHFADGLTEELTAEIVRYQDLRVVAHHSAMKMKGLKISAGEVGKELNVRFFLEGSVRRGGDCIKIAVRLIDTVTQMQIWGEQYRRDLTVENLIGIQEDIAARVAGRIGGYLGVIPRKLAKESRGKVPQAFETYDAFLYMHRYTLSVSEETFCVALDALEQAHRRDPESGVVWAMLANLHADNNALWSKGPCLPMDEVLRYARKGVHLEPQNQYTHTILAYVLLLVGERDDFFREAEATLRLNPNSPTHVAVIGWAMALYGQWEEGLHLLKEAIELNPFYPGWFHMAPCLFHICEGRYKEAYREALMFQSPQLLWDPLLRAVALGQWERVPEARAAAEELLRIKPDFQSDARRLIAFYAKSDALMKVILDGLGKAGLKI